MASPSASIIVMNCCARLWYGCRIQTRIFILVQWDFIDFTDRPISMDPLPQHYSSGWLETHDPPASASCMLRWQACIMPRHSWMISADGTGFSFIFLKKIVLLLLLVCMCVCVHMCDPCHSMPQKSEDTFVACALLLPFHRFWGWNPGH